MAGKPVQDDVERVPFYKLFTPTIKSVRDDQIRFWASRLLRIQEDDLRLVKDIVFEWIREDFVVKSWYSYLKFGIGREARDGIEIAMNNCFGQKKLRSSSVVH